MIRRVRRSIALLSVLALAVGLVGCEDDRGDPAGPDLGGIDADDVFGISRVSASVLQVINEFAARVIEARDTGATLPIQVPGCVGDGRAVIGANADTDPNTFSVTFGTSDGAEQYAAFCDGLLLRFTQRMVITLTGTGSNLRYEVSMPFNDFTGETDGISVLLPQDAGGLTLQVSTPGGPLDCVLDAARSADPRHAGFVHMGGTLRLEDRITPIVVIQELRIEYAYDEDSDPPFALWPAGSLEMATNGQPGIPGGPSVPGFPLEIRFDGFGGATFEINDTVCETNMATGSNPCEDLDL